MAQALFLAVLGSICLHSQPSTSDSWRLATAPSADWRSIACSADGTTLAVSGAGSVYVSKDFGATWTPTLRSDPGSLGFQDLVISADASRITVMETDSSGLAACRLSRDGGTTWDRAESPIVSWIRLASSADGTRLLAPGASVYGHNGDSGPLYRSTDAGKTWVETTAPYGLWSAVASSADGMSLVATTSFQDWVNPGGIYFSADGGLNWRLMPEPRDTWQSVATSGDGPTILVAAINLLGGQPGGPGNYEVPPVTRAATLHKHGSYMTPRVRVQSDDFPVGAGLLYISSDSGKSWTRTAAPAASWNSIAVSTDGQKLAAASSTGIYTSRDHGVTWTRENVPGGFSKVVSSADGARLAALSSAGIYTFELSSPPSVVELPASQIVLPGNTALLRVGAEGGMLAYQWQKNGVDLVNGSRISGTTSPTLTITDISPADAGLYSVAVANSRGRASAETFMQVPGWTQSSAPVTNWTAIASSADGKTLIAAGDSLMLSHDFGATWHLCGPAISYQWRSVAISENGTRLIAAAYSDPAGNEGALYGSWDSGATWERAGAPGYWTFTAFSANDTKLIAIDRGTIYISGDFGGTWTNSSESFTGSGWWAVGLAGSANGAELMAVINSGPRDIGPGPIYRSSDGGETWKPLDAPHEVWASIASSADGKRLVVASRPFLGYPGGGGSTGPLCCIPWLSSELRAASEDSLFQFHQGRIYLSSDSGATWIKAPVPEHDWSQVVCSADGLMLAAVADDGAFYRSMDAGGTWFPAGPAQPGQHWSSIATSRGGARFALAGMHNERLSLEGGIWLASQMLDFPIKISRTAPGARLSWETSSTNSVLLQCTNLQSRMWSVMASASSSGTETNSSVIVPAAGYQFFRLIQP